MSLPQVSRSLEHFIYAYAQTPWRSQRQWIGSLLLIVVGLAMVAALYLDVTSQAAIAGREIQELASQTSAVQHGSADLQSKLAELTSTSAMEQRASALGYEQVDSSELQYVLVPGYEAPQPDILAGAHALKPSAASMPPAYTESLISWLSERLGDSGSIRPGVAP
jgi:hypothetical protein